MPVNYLISDKQKFIEALEQLHILEHLDVDRIKTIDDMFFQIEDNHLKEHLLKTVIDYLIRNSLMKFLYKENGSTDGVKNASEIGSLFKGKTANKIKKDLSRINSRWKLPTTLITSKSLFWSVIVFVLWGIIVFSFLRMHPEFFIVTFDILSITFFLLIMILPELLLRFLLPGIFGVEKFINVRYGYQGQFSEFDSETNWNHFELREYDPIIGRWTATDPRYEFFSPYIGMGNDPVNMTDPTGGSVLDDVYYDSKTDKTTVVKTNDNFDRLYVDGKLTAIQNQGWWKSVFPDAQVFNSYNFDFYNSFGSRLRDDNLFVRLYKNAPSDNARGALFQANQANKDAAILYATLAVPVAVIAAGELLGAAAASEIGASIINVSQNGTRVIGIEKRIMYIKRAVESSAKGERYLRSIKYWSETGGKRGLGGWKHWIDW